jgi:hypothetical protein
MQQRDRGSGAAQCATERARWRPRAGDGLGATARPRQARVSRPAPLGEGEVPQAATGRSLVEGLSMRPRTVTLGRDLSAPSNWTLRGPFLRASQRLCLSQDCGVLLIGPGGFYG